MGVAGSEAATDVEVLPALLRDTDLILDALIGYSLRGAPREPVASWIRLANANATTARRIALDLPSGLDRDAGVPRDPTLRADGTLTLAWPKAGLLAPAARSFVGDLYLADISVPEAVYRAVSVRRGDLFAHGPVVRVRPVTGGWEPDEALASALRSGLEDSKRPLRQYAQHAAAPPIGSGSDAKASLERLAQSDVRVIANRQRDFDQRRRQCSQQRRGLRETHSS